MRPARALVPLASRSLGATSFVSPRVDRARMQGGLFPSTAASTLIQGYCEEFDSLQSVLLQALTQVRERSIDFAASRAELEGLAEGLEEVVGVVRGLLASSAADAPEPVKDPGVDDASRDEEVSQELRDRYRLQDLPSEPASSSHGPADLSEVLTFDANKHADRFGARAAARRPEAKPPAATAEDNADEVSEPASVPTLAGINRDMPLRSVFQFVERTRKSGVVLVRLGGETMSFEFDRGFVQACTTDRSDADKRLGDLLVQTGVCSAQDILRLLDEKDDEKLPLGERVVRSKMATEGQVMVALEEQVRMRFERACDSESATYEFREGHRAARDGRIRVAPMELTYVATR